MLFTLSGAFIIDKISGQKAGYSDSIADYDYYVRTFGNLDCLKDSEKDPMYCVKKAVLQKNMPEVYQAVGTEILSMINAPDKVNSFPNVS